MKTEFVTTKRAVSFSLSIVNDDDLTKTIRKEFKDKYDGGDDLEKVIVSSNSRKNVNISSADITNLTKAFNDISLYLNKRKVEFSASFAIVFTVKTNDTDPDAFDILNEIIKINVANLENMLTFSYRMAATYQGKSYFVEFNLEEKNEFKVYIQYYDEISDLYRLNEEIMQIYYNTIHLAINDVR